jgi:hypothetical protein
MALFSRRRRLAELAAQEAKGASFWSTSFDQKFRNKLIHAFTDAARDYLGNYAEAARDQILRDEGLMHLVGPNNSEINDLLNFILICDDQMMPTVIEALATALRDTHVPFVYSNGGALQEFQETVATALREHRLSYDFINGEMVEFSSRELHEAVTAPALRLLAGRKDLGNVENAYLEALDQLSRGKTGNAITDAGRALQEALSALGCDGNALGPLIGSARKNGLLAGHDSPMADALEKVMHWVSADRSEMGDAHVEKDASPEDAWLIVHVVGALILRLTQGSPRTRVS